MVLMPAQASSAFARATCGLLDSEEWGKAEAVHGDNRSCFGGFSVCMGGLSLIAVWRHIWRRGERLIDSDHHVATHRRQVRNFLSIENRHGNCATKTISKP